MEPSERVETDSLVDMQVAATEGEEQYVEAVGELHEDGYNDGLSGDEMPPEAEDGRNEPPPESAAGADAHFEQVTGDGQVADPSGPSRTPY